VKTLVLGIGNPILSDDSAGFRVVEKLRTALKNREDVVVKETSLSGLSLLDELTGYERLIIVDAIQTKGGKPGDIYRLSPADFKVGRMTVIHDLGLFSALELARKLDMEVPREVVIFAIEAKDIATFSEECSPEVERAIPEAVDMILREVEGVS
jgi:hydrogenase maturation protease